MSLQDEILDIDGSPVRVKTSGLGKDIPAIFLHGGSPGITPYCSGTHIWGRVLDGFADERSIVALDLPGSGQTPLLGNARPSLETMGAAVLSVMQARGISLAHVVGHDEGGLLALWLALHTTERVCSVTVVASKAAAPAGDALPVLTFAHPQQPHWERVSQAWALEQISYSFACIDDALLDACVAAARGPAHHALIERMDRDPSYRTAFGQSTAKAKSQLFRTYREDGIKMPVQLVWGSHDPLTGIDRGFGLFQLIAGKQPIVRFDVINRTGNLPFREEPQAFLDIVAGFHTAVEGQSALRAA